ncbi:DNA topoisomerase 2-like [Pyrus ussuriensis x Pyrus communis]|uniref:DNA topoisomerase (ATP-hydrolyzing) n=1 Tax=Pyrus ussuriensis x Pyrus communis TaxID=2448454 RepID=A0A5N5ILX7_9ROSA|nr:DNA topoisomerase 2-like [Pyrus ussuriensis x Pyrus communis]
MTAFVISTALDIIRYYSHSSPHFLRPLMSASASTTTTLEFPVEIHQEESNYYNTVKKTTGGRKGYGAKLKNIFSTEFIIKTADGMRQKKYKQAEAAMVAKVRHKRLVNLIGLMVKVLNNPRCSLMHSELEKY